MGKKLLIVLFAVLLRSVPGYATHIYGGELLYRHETGNRYRVIVYLYGDCSGSLFHALSDPTASPVIKIYNDTGFFKELHLRQDSLNIDISPVCPAERTHTTCSGGTLPGVNKFIYSDTVTLPPGNWRLYFAGSMGTTAGRSLSITNISSALVGTAIQLQANLNNITAPNSSPRYTTLPTPYYCINIESQYNQGAVDDDGDSLAFRLISGINGNSASPPDAGPVNYIPPATATRPLRTAPAGFTFNALNGQLIFTPDAVQDALVVYQVLEYKAGQLVGTSMREMTFIVTDQCEAAPPKMHITNLSGGITTIGNVINICKGTPFLSFNVQIANGNGDAAYLTSDNVPVTANLTFSNNGTPDATANFGWATGTLPIGVYTFYLVVKDNHCPISTTQTLAYSINVVEEPTVAAIQVSPTQCVHKAIVYFNLDKGYLPRMLTITQGTTVISGFADSIGLVIDSFVAGNYTATVGSDPRCSEMISFSIVDSGKLPLYPIVASICRHAPPGPIIITPAGPGAVITWYDIDHHEMPGAPTPPTDEPATFSWYAQEQYKVCTSDVVSVTAEIHDLPAIHILNRGTTVCYGDSVYLKATGGLQYAWWPEQHVHFNAMGDPYALITDPVMLRVKGVDTNGCFNADSVIYENIQPCCNFFYPTAFTPNNDGHNDGFRVMTYGNMYDYRLEVVNRWGQRVYLSTDQHAQWDGTHGGIPCEMGTYFFRFNARCATGKMEEHHGDVTLIR